LSNNSSVFDSTLGTQNITLFSDIYDYYDKDTGLFSNLIGKITIFKFILNKNNIIYTAEIAYYNFINNDYITSVSIVKNGLNKIGSLVSGVNFKSAIIASSDDYGFNSYFLNVQALNNHIFHSVGYI